MAHRCGTTCLRLTAPTNGMQAQSFFLTNANGNFSDATGAQ